MDASYRLQTMRKKYFVFIRLSFNNAMKERKKKLTQNVLFIFRSWLLLLLLFDFHVSIYFCFRFLPLNFFHSLMWLKVNYDPHLGLSHRIAHFDIDLKYDSPYLSFTLQCEYNIEKWNRCFWPEQWTQY